jgi:uncharacterized RDD family membrane protein YckC
MRRLQRIKEKRGQENPAVDFPPSPESSADFTKLQGEPVEVETPAAPPERGQSSPRRRSVRARSVRTERLQQEASAQPEVKIELEAAPRSQEVATATETEIPEGETVPEVETPVAEIVTPATRTEPAEMQDVIDGFIATMSAGEIPEPSLADVPISSPAAGDQIEPEKAEKLILLSRTLSGLVDLIIITLCGSACVFGADIVSGIVIVDSASILNYSLLMMGIFFLYSVFFLGTTNQTMGMMITELRLVGKQGERPGVGRILLRCVAFLLSVLPLGIGLIWGFFNSESECLHDRLSGTHVVRISWPPT